MTIFYKKVGSRYVPVAEYDSELVDSYPKGTTLVVCTPGSVTRKFNIDPNFAAMIAAGEYAKDAISKALMLATDLRPTKVPITKEQKLAWENLTKSFGEEMHMLQWPSYREATDEGINAMQIEADKMLQHPAVKKAYDHFMMVYKLTKETNDA